MWANREISGQVVWRWSADRGTCLPGKQEWAAVCYPQFLFPVFCEETVQRNSLSFSSASKTWCCKITFSSPCDSEVGSRSASELDPKNGRSTEVALSALAMEPCSFALALTPHPVSSWECSWICKPSWAVSQMFCERSWKKIISFPISPLHFV